MTDLNVIILNALKTGTAIPAFNVPYLPMIEPVIRAVVDQNSFALIETAQIEWIKFEAGGPEAVAKEFFRWQDSDHVRLHLDHVPVLGEDDQPIDYLSIIKRAIEVGFSSVMLDGSDLSLEENIFATRQVADFAHSVGILCEAELGSVFRHEPGSFPSYDEFFASGMGFTKVEEARQFVDQSCCDWLSVAVGSVHGAVSEAYRDHKKISARLDLDRLESLAEAAHVPLVLHGGSGISQEYLRAAFKRGIAKMNIGTEIRQVYELALQSTGRIAAARDAVYERTGWLIQEYLGLSNMQPTVTAGMS